MTAISWSTRGNRQATADLNRPWPWPPEFYTAVQTYLVSPFGPRPARLLPPDPKAAAIAQVVSTKDELGRMVAEKPPLWAWAAVASSLLQQHNSLVPRLRDCASGYQPRPGAPLTGKAYASVTQQTAQRISENRVHLQGFLRGPVLTAFATNAADGRPIDPNTIWHIADRLMEYHAGFLAVAEVCLHTAVSPHATVLAQDTSTMAVCPLVSFAQFIVALCHRVAEARELMAHSRGRAITVDCPDLVIAFPRGLNERINAQIQRFTR